MNRYAWRELTEKDEYARNGDVAMCGDTPLFICEGREYPQKITDVISKSDATAIFRYEYLSCNCIDVGQTGEYPCPVCGLPTVWDEPIVV
ncbi:MAG: hypothetical protein PHV98_00795 [Candidatus Omnitrophica bacterium]|nr:hypothetical protein [Candidatus Omnitrophota bacterium]